MHVCACARADCASLFSGVLRLQSVFFFFLTFQPFYSQTEAFVCWELLFLDLNTVVRVQSCSCINPPNLKAPGYCWRSKLLMANFFFFFCSCWRRDDAFKWDRFWVFWRERLIYVCARWRRSLMKAQCKHIYQSSNINKNIKLCSSPYGNSSAF